MFLKVSSVQKNASFFFIEMSFSMHTLLITAVGGICLNIDSVSLIVKQNVTLFLSSHRHCHIVTML